MYFLAITIANIIWILYSMSEGMRESFFDYYQRFNKRKYRFHIKRIFFTQRIIVLSLITSFLFFTIGLPSILISLAQALMFTYFYKISYDICIKKLKTEAIEKTETNIMNRIVKNKKLLLFTGLIIQIFIYIFLL